MHLFEETIRNVDKFLRYALDTYSFTPTLDNVAISQQALDTAQAIRSTEHGPAILIHGIMPRSGTVYVGELLRLHPDLYAFPNQVWEFPFLRHTPRILTVEKEFLWSYEQNMGKIGDRDFLPLFGTSVIAYLYRAVPPGKRMLLKVPSVEYLHYFYQVFPHEHLLILARDGRDVVLSTLKTWPQLRFSMVCIRWRRAARMVLTCDAHFRHQQGYWLARFEDAVNNPEGFVREACRRFGLDEERYPYERIAAIPIRGSSATQINGRVTWNPIREERFNPVGRWQDWSRYHKWLFKRLAGQVLKDLDYVTNQGW